MLSWSSAPPNSARRFQPPCLRTVFTIRLAPKSPSYLPFFFPFGRRDGAYRAPNLTNNCRSAGLSPVTRTFFSFPTTYTLLGPRGCRRFWLKILDSPCGSVSFPIPASRRFFFLPRSKYGRPPVIAPPAFLALLRAVTFF